MDDGSSEVRINYIPSTKLSDMAKDGVNCQRCKIFLSAAGFPHSGWIKHNGCYYCLSCQEKKHIGLWAYESKAKKKKKKE